MMAHAPPQLVDLSEASDMKTRKCRCSHVLSQFCRNPGTCMPSFIKQLGIVKGSETESQGPSYFPTSVADVAVTS